MSYWLRYQLAVLVPTFDPAVDNVEIWTSKVELLLLTWPPTKIQELATRLVLGCKGTAFQKLQLHKDEILVNDTKGIQKIVELVGGKWGAVPLEKKFEIAERALYRCVQKADETADSFLARSDNTWTELLGRPASINGVSASISPSSAPVILRAISFTCKVRTTKPHCLSCL